LHQVLSLFNLLVKQCLVLFKAFPAVLLALLREKLKEGFIKGLNYYVYVALLEEERIACRPIHEIGNCVP